MFEKWRILVFLLIDYSVSHSNALRIYWYRRLFHPFLPSSRIFRYTARRIRQNALTYDSQLVLKNCWLHPTFAISRICKHGKYRNLTELVAESKKTGDTVHLLSNCSTACMCSQAVPAIVASVQRQSAIRLADSVLRWKNWRCLWWLLSPSELKNFDKPEKLICWKKHNKNFS
jgi:hypothetical protein